VNTSTAGATIFKESVPDSRFLLQPPLNNPFLSAEAIAITRLKDGAGVEVEVTPRSYEDISPDGVQERIIARTRRDVERHPNSARAHTNLGLALLNSGDATGAMREFEVALEYEPNSYIAAVNLARSKMGAGDIDSAEIIYEKTLKHHPNDPSSLMSLAFIRMRRDDFIGAARLLKGAVAHNEKAPLPRYHLAMVLLKLGKANEAISQLKLAARLDVRSPELHHALGVAYMIGGQPKRAARAFKTALVLAPHQVDAIHGLAIVFLQEGDLQGAIALLQQQIERTPEDRNGRELLAHAYVNTRQYERARFQLSYVLQKTAADPKQSGAEQARLANNIATCFSFEGHWAEARRWLTVAIESQPDNPLPYLNLARLQLTEGHVGDAVTLLEKCKNRFNGDETVRKLLAVSYEQLGEYDAAIAQLSPLVGSQSVSLQTLAHLGALLGERRNDFAAAFAVFEEALRRYPLSPLIINNYAYTHLMNGHVDEARTLLNALPKGTELYPELLATFGLLRFWEGDLQQGRNLYQQAADHASSKGNSALARIVRQKMHLELARAYIRRHDTRSAMQHIRSGLSVKQGRVDYCRDLERTLEALRNEQPTLFPRD
jgi:Flp pilus assembly protein TadD